MSDKPKKYQLGVIEDWVDGYHIRKGVLAHSNTALTITLGEVHAVGVSYYEVSVPFFLLHRVYTEGTLVDARNAADAYLSEHFEFPVSLEDKLAAAEKRIAELEAWQPKFKIGQRVYELSANRTVSNVIKAIVLEGHGTMLYRLQNGHRFLGSELVAAE